MSRQGVLEMIQTVNDHLTKVAVRVDERSEEVRSDRRCVVLLSGGLDSTVLMYSLVNDFEVWPITVSYGQRHNKEIMAARSVCEARDHNLLLRWRYVDLSVLRTLLPSALTGVGEIPHGHYESESMKATIVPNRNMILLALAAGYANGIGAKHLAYAPHKGDHPLYPDCREVFIQAVRQAIKLGTGWNEDGVELHTPFSRMTKADIVKLGEKLNVPFKVTWSCYEGGEKHCGVCGTCIERIEAFELVGVKDPTMYEDYSHQFECNLPFEAHQC